MNDKFVNKNMSYVQMDELLPKSECRFYLDGMTYFVLSINFYLKILCKLLKYQLIAIFMFSIYIKGLKPINKKLTEFERWFYNPPLPPPPPSHTLQLFIVNCSSLVYASFEPGLCHFRAWFVPFSTLLSTLFEPTSCHFRA